MNYLRALGAAILAIPCALYAMKATPSNAPTVCLLIALTVIGSFLIAL